MGAGIVYGNDHSLDTAGAEAAGNQYTVDIREDFIHILFCHSLGIYPFDMDGGVVRDAAVLQCLNNTDVSIVQGDVFADQCNRHLVCGMTQVVNHLFPVAQIGFRAVKAQTFTNRLGKMLALHGERRLVEVFHIQILQNAVAGHVTEQRNLIL